VHTEHLFVVGILRQKLDVVAFHVDPLAISFVVSALSVKPVDANFDLRVFIGISAWWPNIDVRVGLVRFRASRSCATSIEKEIQAAFAHLDDVSVDRMNVVAFSGALVPDNISSAKFRVGVILNRYELVIGLRGRDFQLLQAPMFVASFRIATS